MTTPIPLVYFDKGKAPRVVDPVALRKRLAPAQAGPVPPAPVKQLHVAVTVPAKALEVQPGEVMRGVAEALEDWQRKAESRMAEDIERRIASFAIPPRPRWRPRNAAHAAGNAPPVAQVPCPPAPSPPKPPPSPEALRLASEALREYLRLHDRGGHLAPWLRDGKRFRLVDARDQAYARGDAATRAVAGALLALTREELEAVRRAADVPPDIGRVKPEGET